MAFIRDGGSGRVSVGRRFASLSKPFSRVRQLTVLYFVSMLLHQHQSWRNIEAPWIILTCSSELPVRGASTTEQRHSGPVGGSHRSSAASGAFRGLNSKAPLNNAHAKELAEDRAQASQLHADETASRQSLPAAQPPALPGCTAAHDKAKHMARISKNLFNSGNFGRSRSAKKQSPEVRRRRVSGTRAPLDLPTDAPFVSPQPNLLQKRNQSTNWVGEATRRGQNPVSTKQQLDGDAISFAPLCTKCGRSSQGGPVRIDTLHRLDVPWGNTTSQIPARNRPEGVRNLRGRSLQTSNISCRTLPSLLRQDTTSFREACSFLCRAACADEIGQSQSKGVLNPAFGVLSFKLQKAILNLLRASASQQSQLLQQACRQAFQQSRPQGGIAQLFQLGAGLPSGSSGVASASASLSSLTSASSTQVTSAGDGQEVHFLPVEGSGIVSPPPFTTETGGTEYLEKPTQAVATPLLSGLETPAQAVASPLLSENEADSSGTGGIIETSPKLHSSEYHANEFLDFPSSEAVASDAPDNLLFSPDLLENTDASDASSLPRTLTRTAEQQAAQQRPQSEEGVHASPIMRRGLQQALFWQQFIPSGISFDSNTPLAQSRGNFEAIPSSVLFPRTRISWDTANGIQDGLRQAVREAQLRYALASPGERDGPPTDQQPVSAADTSKKQHPDQVTTPELEDIRGQLTEVLYEVLQHLIENPTELQSQLEEQRREQGWPASNAQQSHKRGRGGPPSVPNDSEVQMVAEGRPASNAQQSHKRGRGGPPSVSNDSEVQTVAEGNGRNPTSAPSGADG